MAKLNRAYGAAILAILAAGTAFAATGSGEAAVTAALKERLPKTELAKVDCMVMDGLCEVTAGKSIFYVDRHARYLVVGHVFDMETRQDLTSAQAGRPVARDYPIPKAAPAMGAGHNQLVSLATLPASGAIEWGGTGPKITIFTDFRCGYCRALTAQLETMNLHVVERPISVLGTRELSNRVYCARDRVRALRAAYAGDVPADASCDTSGLDANERFARDNGFTGTPVIVRSDGAVHHGYLPKDELLAWLRGAKS